MDEICPSFVVERVYRPMPAYDEDAYLAARDEYVYFLVMEAGETYKRIGGRLGVTGSRVSQILYREVRKRRKKEKSE